MRQGKKQTFGAARAALSAVLLAALLLAPGTARARDDCGALNAGNSFTETCPDAAYTGIVYWDLANAVTLTVTGGAATTITAGANNGLHNGITIRTNDDATSPRTSPVRNIGLTVGSGGAVAIRQSGTRASSWYNNRGIVVFQRDGDGATTTLDVRSGVTIGTATAKMESRGIEVTTYESDAGDISVTTAAAIRSEDDGVHVDNRGSGATMVINSGAVTSDARGIYVSDSGSTGDIALTNSGAITAGATGIEAVGSGAAGDVSVTNSGAVTSDTTGIIVRVSGAAGDIMVENSSDITSDRQGVFVDQLTSAGAASVTHSAGAIAAETESGVHAQNAAGNAAKVEVMVTGGSVKSDGQSKAAVSILQRGTGDAVAGVSEGATLTSKHNAGIYADLSNANNAAGQIKITQGGTISGRQGVYARVGRVSAAGETRAAAKQPAIDIAWTGAFARGEGTAENDDDRFLASTAARAVAVAQEVEAEKAMRYGTSSLRYGSPAGIEAQVMSWRDMMTAVAKGDDPGAIADNTAQMNLLSTSHADSRRAAILAAFKAALGSADIEVAAAVFDAVKTGATSLTGVTDAEIVTYLETDDAATRTLLRNVLAQGLSDAEKAVLRAVATDTGRLAAALNDEDADFSAAYKTSALALLNRFNAGDIKVAVNGGSIDSRGDGVRAYYATPHRNNGMIDITVAEGAEVTGAMAGVYAANAGRGADGILKQSVTVHGTVTGGTDAAVHLSGGGRLTVGEKGRVLAGASGVAVLVNEPGPAAIVIHGMVRGGRKPDDSSNHAAVHLTGGGSVTVGLTGSVDANGADAAILSSGAATTVNIHMSGQTRAATQAAIQRVTGAIKGLGGSRVTFVEEDENGETGFSLGVPVDDDGNPDLSSIQIRSEEGEERERGQAMLATLTLEGCAAGSDRRCRLYEALPSALLLMSRMPSYAERVSAPRGSNGVWGRIEAASGEWTADKAATGKEATGKELAYDHSRAGGRAGFDFIGPNARVGLSVHMMKGKADMSGAGEIALNGAGFGASLTWTGGDFYVDVQAQATWFDAEIDADMSGKLEKDASGSGAGLGVEIGTRMALMEGAFITPRAGLTWTRADLGDFTDSRGANAARVSVEDASSAKGRLGVMVDAPMADGGGLFATLDLEQEFSNETSVEVANLKFKTETSATALRLGLGGAFSLGEGVTLRASGHYEASGSGTSEIGGGASLSVSF